MSGGRHILFVEPDSQAEKIEALETKCAMLSATVKKQDALIGELVGVCEEVTSYFIPYSTPLLRKIRALVAKVKGGQS